VLRKELRASGAKQSERAAEIRCDALGVTAARGDLQPHEKKFCDASVQPADAFGEMQEEKEEQRAH
jgi:hypothetical protein